MTAIDDTLVTIDISGMTCAACAARLERVLGQHPGIGEVRVSLPLERADLRVAGSVSTAELVAAVEAAGFGGTVRAAAAADRKRQHEARADQRRRQHRTTIVLAVVAVIIAIPFWIDMVIMTVTGRHMAILSGPQQAGLAVLAQILCGARFYRGAWSALRNRSANMDVLVAIGTTAALGLSLFNLAAGRGEHGTGLYFEASVTVLAFLLIGKVLEGAARNGAAATLEALAAGAPKRALKITPAGPIEVDSDSLTPGDRVLVRPGAAVPADGQITEGTTTFDESLLTGDSLPVLRSAGAAVIAGTIASGGTVTVVVTATGEDTRLQKIARLIEDAEIARSPSQQLADTISAYFVPAVVGLALLTLAGWIIAGVSGETALIHAVSVLVVACPCALGLATPIALVAGANAAARSGIITSEYGALETAGRLSRIVFDKTGTLTEGTPALVAFAAFGAADEAMQLAGALAGRSDHPLDRALAERARLAGHGDLPVEAFNAVPGGGLTGTSGNRRIGLGNLRFLDHLGLAKAGADLPPLRPDFDATQSLTYLAVEGRGIVAVFGFADRSRPGIPTMMAALARMGIGVAVLSGDRPEAVAAFARSHDIADAYGGLTPENKIERLAGLRQHGAVIGMVGDGINDTPALRAADVGIAMNSGTEAAKAAASFALVRSDLGLIPKIVAAGRATTDTIRQNLALAFVFNAIGIPLAAAGMLSPALAGAAMALSSVSVVSNAWRLAGKRL